MRHQDRKKYLSPAEKVVVASQASVDARRTARRISAQDELSLIVLKLKTIYATLVTSIAALKYQRSDHDLEVALCLMRCAADPLSIQIERLQVHERDIAAHGPARVGGRIRRPGGAPASRAE